MNGDDERLTRRATFDDVADLYDQARQAAPPEVFDDLVVLAGLAPGDHVLEVGCGTGQATLPLAERGLAITAIELGMHLAERARRNLAPYPEVDVVTLSFEAWQPGNERYAAVVSFNAFHWIDPEVRLAKSAAVLRDGGALCVLGSSFVDHDGADPLWVELQEDYIATTGEPEPRLHVDAVRDRSAEFEEGGRFQRPVRRVYRWELAFDAGGFVSLLRTMSWYGLLEDDERTELFDRIHRRIASSAGGTIAPTMLAVLYVARRA